MSFKLKSNGLINNDYVLQILTGSIQALAYSSARVKQTKKDLVFGKSVIAVRLLFPLIDYFLFEKDIGWLG